jgi:hypothetical protein
VGVVAIAPAEGMMGQSGGNDDGRLRDERRPCTTGLGDRLYIRINQSISSWSYVMARSRLRTSYQTKINLLMAVNELISSMNSNMHVPDEIAQN